MNIRPTNFALRKNLHAKFFHDCAMIDSIFRVALSRQKIGDLEKLKAWAEEQKAQKMAWLEYDEQKLLNNIEGLINRDDPQPPLDHSGRLLKRNAGFASPLGGVGTDNYIFLDLLLTMCSLSVDAALDGTAADFSVLLTRLLDELGAKSSLVKGPQASDRSSSSAGKVGMSLIHKGAIELP